MARSEKTSRRTSTFFLRCWILWDFRPRLPFQGAAYAWLQDFLLRSSVNPFHSSSLREPKSQGFAAPSGLPSPVHSNSLFDHG